MAMDIIDYAALSREEIESLRQELARLHTLGDVLDWMRSLEPTAAAPNVVTQDEFTHDVVVAAGRRYLAFDTT
jgi:hypothetical protein